MAMNIRPDYINPLTTLDKNAAPKPAQPAARKTDRVSELQTKQQQLQNQVLLLRASGTDSAGASAETQKVLEAKLEQVSSQLRAAKADPSQAVEQIGARSSGPRLSRDLYEPEKAQTASPGLYQVEKDKEQGYRISFLPYSEE